MRIRTGYSFRVAVGMIDKVMERLKETEIALNEKAAPISDRASTFGFNRWSKLSEKNGLKPVFGLELAVSPSISASKPTVDYWTFFAIDDIAPLNELLFIATNQFRYEPLLSYEQAQQAKGVFKVIGSRTDLTKVKPDDFMLVGLSPSVSKGYCKFAFEQGFKFIATSDNKFPKESDKGLYEVIVGRGASVQTYPQYILTDEEWKRSLHGVTTVDVMNDALANRSIILKNCNAKLKKATLLSPVKEKTLMQMCIEGAQKLGVTLDPEVYMPRLERELKLIYDKKFEDYFYIMADVMQWARPKMICGPARGSSCGSLACYLLEITTIDPIKYDLLFERFIDITRNNLPDIDVDFSDQNRHLVFEYMEEKYGKEHVARLGTVALYRPRSAVDEAGAALGVPPWKAAKVLDALIVRSSGDSRALQTLEDTLSSTPSGKELLQEYPEILVATKMEGHPRHYSQHAAGIVVTESPVLDYVALDARTGATHCDKKDAEDLNLLKIDALGLTQLSIFEDALAMAGKEINYLESVPLDDPLAFEVFNKKQFSGIFQFNGPALQSICNQIEIKSLEDIVSVTALARPGPMASGGTNEWIKRKGGKKIEYPHPVFEPYLQKTLGIVTYQEQVMQICREIGELSWGDVSTVRNAMSKSLGKEYFDQFGVKFKVGARKKGIEEAVLEKVWSDLCSYGSWAFNRSHSVAYGVVSYWCAYLKAHFPFEFAAATLTHEGDPGKQIKILREMAEEGIEYVPVDRELSTNKWTAGFKDGKKVLVGPLSNVNGIGPKMVSQIIGSRLRGEPLPSRFDKLMSDPRTDIDSLMPIHDAIKRLMPDPAEKNIFTPPTKIIDLNCKSEDYTALVFCVAQQIKPRDENEEINIAKRNGKVLTGPTQSLNLTIADDTDRIFAKINRFNYEKLGKPIVDRGRPGKALYAMKGKVPKDFRMLSVTHVRFIGFMDE